LEISREGRRWQKMEHNSDSSYSDPDYADIGCRVRGQEQSMEKTDTLGLL
jgi:hypothetical protein